MFKQRDIINALPNLKKLAHKAELAGAPLQSPAGLAGFNDDAYGAGFSDDAVNGDGTAGRDADPDAVSEVRTGIASPPHTAVDNDDDDGNDLVAVATDASMPGQEPVTPTGRSQPSKHKLPPIQSPADRVRPVESVGALPGQARTSVTRW